MKKILIVNKSFETGGIQSSMVNMANTLAEECQVDLFLYNPQGPIKERLDSRVRILPVSWRFQAIAIPFKSAIRSGDIRLVTYRFLITLWTKLFTNKLPIACAIKHQPPMLGYDLAMAFHQEQLKSSVLSGFSRVVDCLTDAKVKVAWIHYDSVTEDTDSVFNEPFYQKMDKIFCVSRSLMAGFQKVNPSLAAKTDYCYNFVEYSKIVSQSGFPQAQKYPHDKFICFSACRLQKEKALVRAIKALSPVFQAHSDLYWYIAGDGLERDNIQHAIAEEQLTDRILLLGNQSNPYPYMKNANLVMNVSFFEAAPMVYMEAKALGKPVFATKTASVMELFNDDVDAFICENTEEGIFTRFSELMENREKVAQAEQNLRGSTVSNEESLMKILSLLE